jgi:Ala-tRNA(Pro) deacylase
MPSGDSTDDTDTHTRLVDLLTSNEAEFRIIKHELEGRSVEISKIRGNHPSQAMKAIVSNVRGGGGGKRFILAVIPGSQRINMRALCAAVGAQKGSFASSEIATELTGCVMGAIPPFSFRENLPLIVDNQCRINDEVVFNAGRLDCSIFVKFADYERIAGATFADIIESVD